MTSGVIKLNEFNLIKLISVGSPRSLWGEIDWKVSATKYLLKSICLREFAGEYPNCPKRAPSERITETSD